MIKTINGTNQINLVTYLFISTKIAPIVYNFSSYFIFCSFIFIAYQCCANFRCFSCNDNHSTDVIKQRMISEQPNVNEYDD